jgi:nucleoside-diphosphate-sugar epimerase
MPGRIVIFGGDGFVGWNAAYHLSNKEMVVVCDIKRSHDYERESITFAKVDIRNMDEVRQVLLFKDDIVVNLAASQYSDKKPSFYDTNCHGLMNIVESMVIQGCHKLIHFSSDMAIKHVGPYGESKSYCERFLKGFRKYGFDITILRPGFIVGPGRGGLLNKLFWLIKHNLPVPMIGNGNNRYQMVSVFDCVRAIELAIDRGCPNGEYDLVSLHSPRVRVLLESLIHDSHSDSPIIPINKHLAKISVWLGLLHKEQFEAASNDGVLDNRLTSRILYWYPEDDIYDTMYFAYEYYRRGK